MAAITNPTQLTPPRVAFIDERTGAISREWYRFFLSLLTAVTNTQDETYISPDAMSAAASLADQLDSLNQTFATTPRDELGTMAALQQDDVPWLKFHNNPSPTPVGTGSVYWDGGTTLNLVMTNSVTQKIGEDQYFYIKASGAITKGQLIMFTGAVGASGVVTGAPATGITDGQYLIGIAAENIALNGFGLVQNFGSLRNIDTSGYADGDILYYNPAVAGGLTNTQPTAPNIKATIAVVTKGGSAGGGSIFIRVSTGSVFGSTDSNVQFTALANGDLIQYDSALQYWKNVTPASIIAGASGAPITKTADFTVGAGETWFINNKTGSTCTVTLPTASANTGRELKFQNYQDQLLVSASTNVIPQGGGAAGTAILDNVTGNWATLVSDGTNWVIMQAAPFNILLT